jgi:hypothetical protein
MAGYVELREAATLEYRMAFVDGDGTELVLRLAQRLRPVTIRALTELRGSIERASVSRAPEGRVATLRFDWRRPWWHGQSAYSK